MSVRDDLPETPEWQPEPHPDPLAEVIPFRARVRRSEPDTPDSIVLGEN